MGTASLSHFSLVVHGPRAHANRLRRHLVAAFVCLTGLCALVALCGRGVSVTSSELESSSVSHADAMVASLIKSKDVGVPKVASKAQIHGERSAYLNAKRDADSDMEGELIEESSISQHKRTAAGAISVAKGMVASAQAKFRRASQLLHRAAQRERQGAALHGKAVRLVKESKSGKQTWLNDLKPVEAMQSKLDGDKRAIAHDSLALARVEAAIRKEGLKKGNGVEEVSHADDVQKLMDEIDKLEDKMHKDSASLAAKEGVTVKKGPSSHFGRLVAQAAFDSQTAKSKKASAKRLRARAHSLRSSAVELMGHAKTLLVHARKMVVQTDLLKQEVSSELLNVQKEKSEVHQMKLRLLQKEKARQHVRDMMQQQQDELNKLVSKDVNQDGGDAFGNSAERHHFRLEERDEKEKLLRAAGSDPVDEMAQSKG